MAHLQVGFDRRRSETTSDGVAGRVGDIRAPNVQECREDGISLCDLILHSLGAVGRRDLAEPALLGAWDPSCRLI